MTAKPSETPRTDAAKYDTGLREHHWDGPDYVVPADICEGIERELTALRAAPAREGWVNMPTEMKRIELWGKFAVHGGPQGAFMLYHGFRQAMIEAASTEPGSTQPPHVADIVVAEQAEDEGLWFVAQTASEAYLQTALRKLHAAIEGRRVAPAHGMAVPDAVAWQVFFPASDKLTPMPAAWIGCTRDEYDAGLRAGSKVRALYAGPTDPAPRHGGQEDRGPVETDCPIHGKIGGEDGDCPRC